LDNKKDETHPLAADKSRHLKQCQDINPVCWQSHTIVLTTPLLTVILSNVFLEFNIFEQIGFGQLHSIVQRL